MDVNPGDVLIIGETRFVVVALSDTMVYTRREGAAPHQITHLTRADLVGDSIRIERKGSKP